MKQISFHFIFSQDVPIYIKKFNKIFSNLIKIAFEYSFFHTFKQQRCLEKHFVKFFCVNKPIGKHGFFWN